MDERPLMSNGHAAARARRFAQVDVFTTRAGYGNPVAVVFEADLLDTATMQRTATWMNLSETAFVLAARGGRADFRLRIFTPRQELPFAGHPMVGATHAVLEARPELAGRHRLTLECAAGLLPVRIERNGTSPRIFVEAPTATFEPTAASLPVDLVLGGAPLAHAAPRLVDVGARWLVVEFADAAAVRGMKPDFERVAALTARERSVVGLCVFARESAGDAAIVVRAFCPADGIPEDPVTGSANAAIAAFLRDSGRLAAIGPRYRASQGREVGRNGFVDVVVDEAAGSIAIGGDCVTCINGTIAL
jgi:PhzF family phenazine biosynthesis protein